MPSKRLQYKHNKDFMILSKIFNFLHFIVGDSITTNLSTTYISYYASSLSSGIHPNDAFLYVVSS